MTISRNSSFLNRTTGQPYPAWLMDFHTALQYTLLSIVTVGCLLNSFVFFRLIKILRRRVNLTPAWALLAMCLADVACLLSLGSYFFADRLFALPSDFDLFKTAFCKLTLFITHTASAFSVWCWVVLSSLRYVAIFHPVAYVSHRKIRQPSSILLGTAFTCAVMQLWILCAVEHEPRRGCAQLPALPKPLTTSLHAFEITWTYYVPVLLLLVVDLNVIRQQNHPRHPLTGGGSQPSACRRRRRQRRQLTLLKRYLFLTSADLLLNLPSCTIRLIGAIDGRPYGNALIDYILPAVAYVLYYSQFCINILYLWVLVDQRESKASTGTASRSAEVKVNSTIENKSCKTPPVDRDSQIANH